MTRRFRQHPATIFRRLSDGVVVLALTGDEDRDPVFLAGTGGDLWDALATPCSLDELGRDLSRRYDQPAGRITADLLPVLEDLLAGDLITDEPPTNEPPTNAPPRVANLAGRGPP